MKYSNKIYKKEKYQSKFAAALRNVMDEKKITQKTLGEYLKLSSQQISNFCNGNSTPNIDQLIKISEVLNVSCNYLLGITDSLIPDNEGISKRTGLSDKSIQILSDLLCNGIDPIKKLYNKSKEKYKPNYGEINPTEIINLFFEKDLIYELVTKLSSLMYDYSILKAEGLNDNDFSNGFPDLYNEKYKIFILKCNSDLEKLSAHLFNLQRFVYNKLFYIIQELYKSNEEYYKINPNELDSVTEDEI